MGGEGRARVCFVSAESCGKDLGIGMRKKRRGSGDFKERRRRRVGASL
jgi:hypothetical protein